MKKFNTLLLLICSSFFAQAQLNLTYVSNLLYNNNLSDIWGYVAPDGTEYALVGVGNGVSIVSLADPENPVEVDFVPGDQSTWRDLKTWGTTAYVTCDEGNDGLTVIDLSNLPNSVTSYQLTNLPNGTLNTCHNIYIDEFGYAYLAGCNLNNGGMIILDCFTTPGTPAFVVNAPNTYAHDVYTRDNKMYSSEINNGVFTIYDVADKFNIVALGNQETPFSFTHNAWLSDDGNTLFTTDELANAPVAAYDVSNPSDIQFLDAYAPFETLGDGVIPHNVHVWQNWLIVSYYTDGCIIIDATYPDNLVEVGNFDTYIPPSTGFNGVWGAYPFLPSGLVLCTDIGNGLYVLEPNYVQACYLHGDVTDAVTGAAIPGATATFVTTPSFGITDGIGEFKTGIATAGTYDIEVFKPGYESATVSAVMENGVITTISVQLTPLPSFAVSGIVIEAGTAQPIADAVVNISNAFFNFDLVTDVNGSFTLPTIFEGAYDIYGGKWGYSTTLLSAENLSEFNNTITLEVTKGYEDVFALDLGWTATGDGGIFGAKWERGDPIGVIAGPNVFISPEDDVDDLGTSCYVTGNSSSIPETFLLNGSTRLTSPAFNLTGYQQPMVSYHFWYLNAADGNPPPPGDDELIVSISNGVQSATLGTYTMEDLFTLDWQFSDAISLDSIIDFTNNMTIRVDAKSSTFNFITEAAFDDFRIWDAMPVGVNTPVDQGFRIGIYPNPSATDFHLDYDIDNWNGKATLILNNILGQKMLELPLGNATGAINFGADLSTGVYFAQINTANQQSQVIKLIKE